MMGKDAISPMVNHHQHGFFSSIFLVLKKFVPHHHFKIEGIHTLKDLLRQGDFMAKIDLKDACFAVPISAPDRKYLRFRWRENIYQFNCLSFELSCAPWVFTKITKAVMAVLR